MQHRARADDSLTIGKLAQEVGVGVETIRYYHRLGLLEEPPKFNNARRRYPREAVVRLRFIRRAQTLGFTLREIQTLLSLGEDECTATRSMAEEKLQAIEEQLAELKAARRSLQALLSYCESGSRPDQDRCGLFAALLAESGADH